MMTPLREQGISVLSQLRDWHPRNLRSLAVPVYSALSTLSLGAAFLIRFEGQIPPIDLQILLITLPLAVALKLLAADYFGIMREMPYSVSVRALERILKGAAASSVAFIISVILFYGSYGRQFPRSIFILDFLMTILLFGGSRFLMHMLLGVTHRAPPGTKWRNTLVIGAGATGELALRALDHDFPGVFKVVGYLDDDPSKRRMALGGYPILGTVDDARRVIDEEGISEVVIALPMTTKERTRSILRHCASRNVRYRIIPTASDRIREDFGSLQMRALRIDDLLGRESVELDFAAVCRDVAGKSVLVTGAGGSIGSELVRQLAKCKPAKMLLLDVAETPLFEINQDLEDVAPDVPRESLFADIKHRGLICKLFQKHKPDRVFHAAAFKHVSMNERHPVEAVFNNVLGTRNLIEAAIRHGTGKFVMVSTDKAIRPLSIMGATKRCAELLLSHMDGLGTQVITVRLGNVLGSAGSVVPIFQKQIAHGGPVTVTHPDVERYFMTIREAVELMLQAGAHGSGGELYLLEMGEPVKIVDLARSLIQLAGPGLGRDIAIRFTGLKPGEKLSEQLVGTSEHVKPTTVPKLMLYELPRRRGSVHEFTVDLHALEEAAMDNDDERTREALWHVVRRHGREPESDVEGDGTDAELAVAQTDSSCKVVAP